MVMRPPAGGSSGAGKRSHKARLYTPRVIFVGRVVAREFRVILERQTLVCVFEEELSFLIRNGWRQALS